MQIWNRANEFARHFICVVKLLQLKKARLDRFFPELFVTAMLFSIYTLYG